MLKGYNKILLGDSRFLFTPPSIEGLKLAIPLDIGSRSPDGIMKSEMCLGTMTIVVLTPAIFNTEEQP